MGFRYLFQKIGKKGQEVEHFSLRMAAYLVPNNSGLARSKTTIVSDHKENGED